MLKAGDKLGEYIIEKPISVGETGQADVYLAKRADGGGRHVAVKVLAEHLKNNQDAIKNFCDEADILVNLHHPAIVRLESFDTSPPTPYIAQEYVEGQSIAEWLKSLNEPASINIIVDISLQIAEALHYAHVLPYFETKPTKAGGKASKKRQGLIHRDLSTDNILITKEQKIKLIDFGIAKAVGISTVTTRNTSLGKEYYVAPEVEIGVGKTSSPAADIYSFGVCLYEMVMTNKPEKKRINVLKQFQRNLHALHSVFPDDIPEELKKLITHCVQREPYERPESMEAVKQVLYELQAKIINTNTHNPELEIGVVASPRSLKLVRVLSLDSEEMGGGTVKLALNEDGSRFFLLCDECTKVFSFNEYGGERQTHYAPRGQQLATIAGGKGDVAFSISSERANVLQVDSSGKWRPLGSVASRGLPKIVPDNSVYSNDSLYLGDYNTNRILRLSIADAQVTGCTPDELTIQLGPFGIGSDSIFFVDMASRSLLRADLLFQSIRTLCTQQAWSWPTWLAISENLLFLVDAQNKSISILTTNGELLDPQAATWSTDHEITQIFFASNSSQIVMLDSASPALLFFDISIIDLEIPVLAKALHLPLSELPEFSYKAIERMLLDSISKAPDKRNAALKAIEYINKSPDTHKKGLRIQAAIYDFLLNYISPETLIAPTERPSFLRILSEILEQLGEFDKAKKACQDYLNEKDFDPDVRDRYGRLLEQEQRWKEIKEFEGSFLSQDYFEKPSNREAYSRSYKRLRKAYAILGIPLPKVFNVPPTAELTKARILLEKGNYEEARAKFKEIIDDEGYTLLKGEDAITILEGYVNSIKRALRVLSLEDWKEIYRGLSILVGHYSNTKEFNPDFQRDLAAAKNQVEKLNKSNPNVKSKLRSDS